MGWGLGEAHPLSMEILDGWLDDFLHPFQQYFSHIRMMRGW